MTRDLNKDLTTIRAAVEVAQAHGRPRLVTELTNFGHEVKKLIAAEQAKAEKTQGRLFNG